MKRLWVLLVLMWGLFGVAAVAAPVLSLDNLVYAVSIQNAGSVVSHMFEPPRVHRRVDYLSPATATGLACC